MQTFTVEASAHDTKSRRGGYSDVAPRRLRVSVEAGGHAARRTARVG